jgi:hypothetical protein
METAGPEELTGGLRGGIGDTGDGVALGGGSAWPSPTRRRALVIGEAACKLGARDGDLRASSTTAISSKAPGQENI